MRESNGFSFRELYGLLSAWEHETPRGAGFHLERAEAGQFYRAVFQKPAADTAQHGIQGKLGSHGGGSAAQLLAHEFLQLLSVGGHSRLLFMRLRMMRA